MTSENPVMSDDPDFKNELMKDIVNESNINLIKTFMKDTTSTQPIIYQCNLKNNKCKFFNTDDGKKFLEQAAKTINTITDNHNPKLKFNIKQYLINHEPTLFILPRSEFTYLNSTAFIQFYMSHGHH